LTLYTTVLRINVNFWF